MQIGYSLVDPSGSEVAFWGDTFGRCSGIPDVVVLPNGDRVHCAQPNEVLSDGYRIVPRMMVYGSSDGISFDGTSIVKSVTPWADLVVRERERRLALGFTYSFGDERGSHNIGTTDQDMKGWDEVRALAFAAVLLGQPQTSIPIVTNTGPVTVTAEEWLRILVAAGNYRQPIWAASFKLQSMNPIPADYTSDHYWVS